MKEDVKQKHFSSPLRETWMGACIQDPFFVARVLGSNAWRATECDRDTDRSCWFPLRGFMQRSRHHRCEAAQANRWLKCQPSSYVRLEFIRGLNGSLWVTFEEGTSAAWLQDLLKPHVDHLIVCDPRKNALLKDGQQE
jgi:hypothetical protein